MLTPSMVAPLSISELAPIDAQSGFAYGLGWASFQSQGYEVIEKGGALDGLRTVVVFVPALNVGVAVLANLNLTVLPEAIRAFVLDQLLGRAKTDMQQEIQETGAAIEAIFASEPQLPANRIPPPVPLEAFAGVYESPLQSTTVHWTLASGSSWRAMRCDWKPGQPGDRQPSSTSTTPRSCSIGAMSRLFRVNRPSSWDRPVSPPDSRTRIWVGSSEWLTNSDTINPAMR